MAKAPRPGTRPRPVAGPGSPGAEPVRTGFLVTFKGEKYPLDMDDLTASDDALMIRETGLSLIGFTGNRSSFGYGSMAAIAWMAMRANGYRKLTWATFSNRIFPRMTEMMALVESGELAIEPLDPGEENPEDPTGEMERQTGPDEDPEELEPVDPLAPDGA